MQTIKLPDIEVKDLNGNPVNFSEVSNDENSMIIVFWATWCKPCLNELNAIGEVYSDWQEETGVKLVAVSIDDPHNAAKVAPYVKSKAWEYEVYLDENSDLKRAMGIDNVPHTFILNGKGEIGWQQNNYFEGDADRFIEILRKLKI